MKKILILDDADDLLDLLTVFLTTNGFKVRTASSKRELDHILPVIMPDLILIDVRLGGYDGREICNEIKKNASTTHIPVILLSASPELLKDYEKCGATATIEKPFSLGILLLKIKEVLSKG